MDKGVKWDKGIREANGIRGQGDRPGDQGIGVKSSREVNGMRGTSGQLTSLYRGIFTTPW